MSRFARRAVSSLLILSLTASSVPSAQAASVLTRADYEACQGGDEASFRAAVEAISVNALESGTKSIDYLALVNDEWRRQGLDSILDKRVDAAVEEVRAETSWSGLAQSLISKEKAQALATQVAERVYRSQEVKTAIEGLATGVGREVGRAIELASLDAAGPVLECLRAFLGPRYGATVAAVVTGNAESDFGLDPSKGGVGVSSGDVLKQSSEGITGAAILLMRRQLANMTARLGQRLAGSVLARLVSVAAGGVGLVLIAKDLWDLRKGVLPIIAEEMKSQATKDNVKAELARSIGEQIGEHVREIAAKSADRIVEIWQEFRRAHTKVLDLAAANEGFRGFVDQVKPEQLARLDEVTALVFATEGEAAVLKRLDDGSLNEAVRFMPDAAMAIARDTRSLGQALAWSELAGDRIDKVAAFEIYRKASPADFTRASFAQLVALDDPLAISRLAGVGREARERLFDLPPAELKSLARSLTESELATLASYLTGLAQAPRERVLRAVANDPGRMQLLSSAHVRDAIIASRDQTAAVNMMLRDDGGAEAVVADFTAVSQGRVSPILFLDKHPFPIALALLLALVLILMLRRLIFAGRPRTA